MFYIPSSLRSTLLTFSDGSTAFASINFYNNRLFDVFITKNKNYFKEQKNAC
jgi:hypothetical protein